ncbi:PPC domain-containing DNA-binding protein [Patulibacter sp.]|uniref:PPC domain-containing DNA-binding protein n=1 Tax=Patulibacter sp. TaxID=1912859 RepID=UPI0027166E60|nr:PPC domain-containing DNA-binding protein [Patulibacter sp.]MDO9410057.1 DNA-binding protein [Patulibacter sp.]
MRATRLTEDGSTLLLVFETGDEVVAAMTAHVREHAITAARFTAVGGFSTAVVGWLDWERKDYRPIPIDEQTEVLSLTGDVALQDDEPVVHAHVVLGKADGTAHGGHLLEGHVRPTVELVLDLSPAHLRKRIDPESRQALIDPGLSDGA